MSNEKIIELVNAALKRVYADHIYLIDHRVHERSIVFWFGVYFHELLQDTEFAKYDLDVEYNRNYDEKKIIPSRKGGALPDLILHRRGNNDSNKLIMEFKPWWDRNSFDDILKLENFTNQAGEYKYSLGVFVVLEQQLPCEFTYVIAGKVQEEAYE